MECWRQWLGARIAEMKSSKTDMTYENIGQCIRAELREQEDLDPTEAAVLKELEGKIPGKLGTFIGNIYRTHIKT